MQNVLYFPDDLVQICARRKRGFPEALRRDPATTRKKEEEKVPEDIAESGDPRGSASRLDAPGWHDPGLPSGCTDDHARMDFPSRCAQPVVTGVPGEAPEGSGGPALAG